MAFRRQVKNFVKNYSDAEIKVREATSNDPWGPSSSLMLAISDLTFNTISLSEIMNMLWQRLNDHGKNWRHVYKSLMLMDYLLKNGSKKVIQLCREGLCNLQTLKDFQHVDEAGKDQGYHIREKSKQVVTLLMDEQLLQKEREVACRTRRRSSYSMAFSKRLPHTGNSPTAWASAPTPEAPASENKYKLLKVARQRERKNTSKAGWKQEQWQDSQLPGDAVLSQETLPLKFNAWKSSEDLMLFYEDDPKPVLPTVPPTVTSISSTTWLSEGQAEDCNLWNADAVTTPSEKNPSLQTNVNLDKKPESTVTNTVPENPFQMPPEKQSTAKNFEKLTTLPTFGSLSKEESIHPSVRISKSDSTFYNRASVETLYVSPSYKMFDPAKETVTKKDAQKPAQPSIVQRDADILKSLTEWVSTTSEGTSSFSTLSISSPGSASPDKCAPLLPRILTGPSYWALSHQQSSSVFFEDKDKKARVRHPFAPRSPLSSDEETDNFNLLESLPDNSDSAKKKISPISSSNWAGLSTQSVDHFTSVPCPSFQTTKGLPQEPKANSSIQGLLGEVKNAIVKLHEDLSMVIQELCVINSHLVRMSGNSPQASTASPLPQSSEESSGPIESPH
ncbi:ENTH domain-containing protein 1 [Pipistrellus kuhlii]|uniref:ENTH domain containing 1 n=1 Tax=Pipistrellus kuhlii TaxID=59472 RepID=A0A7J7ZH12_PIPKU|nr:ENTH domain-containing protein 1 [Pipistrellus kuhlii]KAF6373553.1 ENTH domain containing 1 [Pipistrellus kuhlii]